MNFEELKNPELQEKLKNAKTAEELLVKLAKEEGVELSDAQLSSISGGVWCDDYCTDMTGCTADTRPYYYPRSSSLSGPWKQKGGEGAYSNHPSIKLFVFNYCASERFSRLILRLR